MIETKGTQGGGAPGGAELRPGSEYLQDGKAPSRRSRSFTNLPGRYGASREFRQDPRRCGDDLRLTWTLKKEGCPR